MAPYIAYRSQRGETLQLAFSPRAEFRDIVDSFAEIAYPRLAVSRELVSFALLELVSNSVRAHREKAVAEEVRVGFVAGGGELRVTILDAGRGFDPTLLPYDLEAPPDSIDLLGDSFAEYRERHGGSRFGMGLYIAKRTFPRFRLSFVDREGRPCPWFSGSVKGTRIELAAPLAPPAPEAPRPPLVRLAAAGDLGEEVLGLLEPADALEPVMAPQGGKGAAR